MAKNTSKTGKKPAKKEAPIEVKAKEVMAVNDDGSMEPLKQIAPEIAPEETVTVEPETVIPEPASAPAQTVLYAAPREPMVKILYLDSAIENNEIPIGGGRVVTGSGRIFNVKLSDFEGIFMTPLVLKLLKKRKFIVLDGLTQEQREQYGVDYREGEIVKNEGMFDAFLNLPTAKAAEMFEQLCQEHRDMVARRFMDAFEKHDNRLTRDRVEALNRISKRDFEDGRGAFTHILEEINKAAL